MFLPIRTESSVRHAPVANVGLIFVNIAVYLFLDFFLGKSGAAFKDQYFILDGEAPRFFQLVTYQFAHADPWHLLGNMLFLWVFGNSVNAKLGDLPYVLFYIAGGMFAGLMFGWQSTHSLLGASGAIAAITTAYLVLFPRSRVTVLYVFFFIGFIEIPATIVIGLKIILWDNIIAPQMEGPSQVAYSAHLAGYLFGFLGASMLLLLKAVPRDQFDMLALIRRWNQRRAFAAAMTDPRTRAQAQYGRVARVDAVDPAKDAEWHQQMDRRTELRTQVADAVRRNDMDAALAIYEQLLDDDPDQCLPEEQQLAVAREYYRTNRAPQAAATFERYLNTYRTSNEANEVRLLLGIINARDLQRLEAAEAYLAEALKRATNPARRQQAEHWLAEVRGARPAGG